MLKQALITQAAWFRCGVECVCVIVSWGCWTNCHQLDKIKKKGRISFSYSSGDLKFKIKGSAGLGSFWRLQGRILLCLLQPLVVIGFPWLVATLLHSLPPSSYGLFLYVFSSFVSCKDTCHWIQHHSGSSGWSHLEVHLQKPYPRRRTYSEILRVRL